MNENVITFWLSYEKFYSSVEQKKTKPVDGIGVVIFLCKHENPNLTKIPNYKNNPDQTAPVVQGDSRNVPLKCISIDFGRSFFLIAIDEHAF